MAAFTSTAAVLLMLLLLFSLPRHTACVVCVVVVVLARTAVEALTGAGQKGVGAGRVVYCSSSSVSVSCEFLFVRAKTHTQRGFMFELVLFLWREIVEINH